jgi:hypothetical protein
MADSSTGGRLFKLRGKSHRLKEDESSRRALDKDALGN